MIKARYQPTAVALALTTVVLAGGCRDGITDTSPGAELQASAARTRSNDSDAPLASSGWRQTGRDLVVKYRSDPLVATRTYALLSAAHYLAIRDDRDRDSDDGDVAMKTHAWRRGALAGASAAILTRFYPDEAAFLESLVRVQANDGRRRPHLQFTKGEVRGRDAAAKVLARAEHDGFDAPWTGEVPIGPGLWVRTGTTPPARPALGQMKTFFLERGDQFRPGPPPAFDSPTSGFAAALAEVVAISATRTQSQLDIANFWALRPGTVTTLGYWDARAEGLIEAARLGEREATRMIAVIDAAAMDAAIGCWDAKYTYWLLRPSHAAPAITLPIGLPSHPSYPSGHSCVSGAASEVLAQLFPAEGEALRAEAVEAGRSRVYAGIHYQFDADVGLALGRDVARFALGVERRRGMRAVLR